jgi:membrane protease YdiL (CAAX protease family)
MVDLLNFKHGSYDFGRVMRRIIMAVAILLIFLLRKSLMINAYALSGIRNTNRWWEHLKIGFLLGTGIFILYTAFSCANDNMTLDMDAKSPGDLILKLTGILFVAFLVAFIEEVIFRGFILQSLLKDMGTVSAICISSLIFSILHFFKTKLLVSTGIHLFVGFIVIYQSFKNIIINFTSILPSVIGIFLIGVVLSYACIRTKSLYLAIGLHAGWIFIAKTNTVLFDQVRTSSKWLYGDSTVATGLIGWILLIITFFLIRSITKVSINGKNFARIS